MQYGGDIGRVTHRPLAGVAPVAVGRRWGITRECAGDCRQTRMTGRPSVGARRPPGAFCAWPTITRRKRPKAKCPFNGRNLLWIASALTHQPLSGSDGTSNIWLH